MALGVMFTWLDDLVRAYAAEGLAAVWDMAGLAAGQISALVEAFNQVVAKLRMEIAARMAPWRKTPLILCGLLADDETVAVETARVAHAQDEEDVAAGRPINRVSC